MTAKVKVGGQFVTLLGVETPFPSVIKIWCTGLGLAPKFRAERTVDFDSADIVEVNGEVRFQKLEIVNEGQTHE